ncbi:MAG: esterase-like activity of phytase family protein [Cyanobacteriota bacterium]|nr:esterase-like activity of phytase family protein [Cyanobacteriota bacterium]
MALFGMAFVMPAQAAPQLTNGLTLAGDLLDLSGGTSVNNGRMGFFSDLYYDPNRNEWWGLSDRGPGGGTISYNTRVHRFSLSINPATGTIANFQLEETIPFRSGTSPLNGLAPNPSNVLGLSFDPEGFVIAPRTGNFLVSDEYGPSLYEFSRDGALVRQYMMPANILPKVNSNIDYTATPKPGPLTSGREPNRGLEGLAISPDGRYAYAMLQNGTVTDGNSSGSSFARSLYARILKFDLSSGGVVSQYAYPLDGASPPPSQGRGISALVALDDHRFLVLERNNRGVGVDSTLSSPQKLVYLINLQGASDVSLVDLIGTNPPGVIPVSKQPTALINLADPTTLADPSLAGLGGLAAEKWEGLTIGPKLNDGSFLLLAGTDNDYSVTQNGTATQFDVYFNPSTRQRAQCDLGTQQNCVAINTDGSLGSSIGNLPSGYALIPGVLQAYKSTAADLGGYTAPVPGPGPVLGAAAALSWARQLRQRIRL